MTETDYSYKLEELDRLLNDPEVDLEPDRIWSLLAEISQHDLIEAPAMQARRLATGPVADAR